MAAPRLHLGHVAARSGQSEDEEVEVLRSGVHDDDVASGNSSSTVSEKQRQSNKDDTRSKSASKFQSKERPDMQIAVGGDRDLADRRSETSTPEADASAVLFASTNSEAVPDHQEASDRLQDRSVSSHGSTNRSRVGSNRSVNSFVGPYQSTPTDDAEATHETVVPSSPGETLWNADDMKRALKFFFLNPLEKYRSTKRFPWKLALQVVKILIVTTQLIVFGDMRMSHAVFSSKTQTALRHLFLANWTSDRDMLIYPPTVPQFSIYEVNDFYVHLTNAVKKYYVLPNVAVATLVYDCRYDHRLEHWNLDNNRSDAGRFVGACPTPPLNFCVELLQAAESHLANRTYHYDMRTVRTCIDLEIPPDEWNSTGFSINDVLAEHNITIAKQRFVKASLSFRLKTIHLKRLQPADEPDCFHLTVDIVYDNSEHTGDILVSLDTTERFINCFGEIEFPTYNVALAVLVAALDAVVLGVCIASLVLCVRAVIRARRLHKRTNQFFLSFYGHNLSKDDSLKFVNFWYLLILVNDVCLIMGTIFKLTIEYQHFDSSLFTATGMLLGLGTLIVWAGILRYLAFFPKYNVLIVTLKRSLPNVLRFMACAGILYAGFVFCGWVVLGPYHMKFRTLMMTSECLFALLNGDDMFATFATTSDASPAVLWFARLYLYLFISLFTYVVLSLFISIIMEAYEVMKDRQQYQPEQSDLETFIGLTQFDGDNSAAAGSVQTGLLTDTPSPSGGFMPRLRRRMSRQRSNQTEDPQAPYVRFDDEPVIIENPNPATSSSTSSQRA